MKIECLVSDFISLAPLETPSIAIQQNMRMFGLEVADSNENGSLLNVQILIGADNFWNCVYSERIKTSESLLAIRSVFGWLVAGIEKNITENRWCLQNAVMVAHTAVLKDLRVFWELDSMGINDDRDERSDIDTEIINPFEKSLQFKNGKYEANLLWKHNPDDLKNNFEIAKKRFVNLKNKLSKSPEVYEHYKEIIEGQLKQGIVEECLNDEMNSGYYMPHLVVIRSSETTNVRIVYDASSKAENTNSLNDYLESGPNLNPNVLDVM